MQNSTFYQTKRIWGVKPVIKEKGIYHVFHFGTKIVLNYFFKHFSLYYYKIFKSLRTFKFQSHTYHYFYQMYTYTWKNERAIEIPIFQEIMKKYNNEEILEVGNVLSHYTPYLPHDVLDKYEKADSIINEDVIDFQPSKKYDLIVSISTIEHVGWDEEPRDSKKILHTLNNLTSLLREEGKIVVSFPLGYNKYLDMMFKKGSIYFTNQYYLKRISSDNKWVETEWDEVREARYDTPFPAGNAIVVGIIEKEAVII